MIRLAFALLLAAAVAYAVMYLLAMSPFIIQAVMYG